MPRLTKQKDKIPMIIEQHLQGRRLLDVIDGKVEYKNNQFSLKYDSVKLYDLIDEIIENYLPTINDEYFDKFVDIKEVPYGRHNSDPDYRGSGTKLP